MKVLKFGGTSVGSAERFKNVAKIVIPAGKNVVVLSAMAGTTNSLLDITRCLREHNLPQAQNAIETLRSKYEAVVEQLYTKADFKQKASDFIKRTFDYLSSFSQDNFSDKQEKIIVAHGEQISTYLFSTYLEEQGVRVCLIPALSFMYLDEQGEPDSDRIKELLHKLLSENAEADLYITQGFICMNAGGEIDNLKRGGSDYTASLIGAAICADEIQIWTDIDGLHNNDPRIVDGTTAVRHLYFEEAAELAYFGAKILHPTCILPAIKANVPVRLLNTMEPQALGTLIDNIFDPGTIKAVAAKDNIVAIQIKSSRMLLAYGFLRKVFEIFENYHTSIDMICTSEVGVSLTIDDTRHLDEIISDLKQYGTVNVDTDMCIICVAGDMHWSNRGFESRVMTALKDIPVRMVSYGGSNYNISILVREEDKAQTLKSLSKNLF